MCSYGTSGNGLSGMVVFGWWLDLMILEVLSGLNDSMILCPKTYLSAQGPRRCSLPRGSVQTCVAACDTDVRTWAGRAGTNRHSQGMTTLESRCWKQGRWAVPWKCLFLSSRQNPVWWPRRKNQGGANQLLVWSMKLERAETPWRCLSQGHLCPWVLKQLRAWRLFRDLFGHRPKWTEWKR